MHVQETLMWMSLYEDVQSPPQHFGYIVICPIFGTSWDSVSVAGRGNPHYNRKLQL